MVVTLAPLRTLLRVSPEEEKNQSVPPPPVKVSGPLSLKTVLDVRKFDPLGWPVPAGPLRSLILVA
jgi:hypothetical protein